MTKKIILQIILFYFTGCILSDAQTQRICGTPEHDKYLRSVNPEYAKERDEMESKIAAYIAAHPSQRKSGASLIIPVVVHMVYNTPDQNLSDEQIISQLDALNEDYSSSNANIVEVPSVWASLVGSSHIYFSLARKDVNGNAFSGITRTQTIVPFFNTNDDVKDSSEGGINGWDPNHYLNIWVCNLQNGGSQDILGYATYPSNSNSSTDGVVINYKAFGRIGTNLKPQYNLGRTATHEIGHWLNLLHIWGDDNGGCDQSTYPGTDYIMDTPNQADNTYGCPSAPHISCNNGPDGDMFQNYMDYTDDRCMMLFTTDQRSRMDDAIITYRDTLYDASSYALPVTQLSNDLKISNLSADANTLGNVVCEKYIHPGITVQNAGTNTITAFSIEYRVDDDSLVQFNWSGTLLPGAEVDTTLPQILISEDLHLLIANITDVNGGSDDYTLDNFKTRSFLYAPSKYSCPVYPETPEITILPNPASESISIETKYKEAQQATLSIYNILGKRVYSSNYLDSHGEALNVYVSGLANGIYFIEVKTFNQQVSKKFVVNHQ